VSHNSFLEDSVLDSLDRELLGEQEENPRKKERRELPIVTAIDHDKNS